MISVIQDRSHRQIHLEFSDLSAVSHQVLIFDPSSVDRRRVFDGRSMPCLAASPKLGREVVEISVTRAMDIMFSFQIADTKTTRRSLLRSEVRRQRQTFPIQHVEMQYSADEDTAHIESLSFRPAAASTTKGLSDRVAVFGLDFTSSANLGREHSLSNDGTLIWDLSIDRIDSFHSETYINVRSASRTVIWRQSLKKIT